MKAEKISSSYGTMEEVLDLESEGLGLNLGSVPLTSCETSGKYYLTSFILLNFKLQLPYLKNEPFRMLWTSFGSLEHVSGKNIFKCIKSNA